MTHQVGGRFLIEETDKTSLVTPEDFSEEQRLIAESAREFMEKEVLPREEKLEALDYELTLELLRQAGELGFLGAEVPEAFGGMGLDKVSAAVIAENMAKGASFSLSMGAHTGIGTLPLVFFGTREQKEAYLPSLATGEMIAAYCLTEPSSGSDSLSARTTATLSEDQKHYVLNGQKQFITNAGFADLFVVYAQVNGSAFSTFIVERDREGVSLGPEEKKMGIKGSSTRPLLLDDVCVPATNLLGEVGKGHVIAFNILNIGRFKLALGCLGGAKDTIELSAAYANERQQFGRPISDFPLVRGKLADMNILTYALESMVYRTAGLFDHALNDVDHERSDSGLTSAKAIAAYAVECSINKVFGSEVLQTVADEGLQIHGGYGYIQEYKIERIYRDARINRIFEGTNEINRLLIPGTLVKMALKGELPLMQKAEGLQDELLQLMPKTSYAGTLEEETHLVAMAKKIFLFLGGQAFETYDEALEEEQELVSHLSDIVIQIYAMESVLLRTQKRMQTENESKVDPAVRMTRVFIHQAMDSIERWAKEGLSVMTSGDALRTQLSILKKLTRRSVIPVVEDRRKIAERIVEREQYVV